MSDTSGLQTQYFIKLEGDLAPGEIQGKLTEVEVETSLHLPDVAVMVFNDANLKLVDDARLEPGKAVEVWVDVLGKAVKIFDGEITELEPVYQSGGAKLTVRALDRLHRLTHGHVVRSYVNVTDGDVIEKIAKEVGLETKLGETREVHPYLLQHNQTNLEFLRERAANLGYMLFVRGKTLHCEPHGKVAEGKTVELQFLQTLLEFRPRMTTLGQPKEFTVRGWDPKKKKEIVGKVSQTGSRPQLGQDVDGGSLAQKAFNLPNTFLVSDTVVRTQQAADDLARSVADQHGGRFIEADGVSVGQPELVAGGTLKLKGLGSRFEGEYHVTQAVHELRLGEAYVTRFTVSGQEPRTLLSVLRQDSRSGASLPGLTIALVTNNDDPDKLGRVKLKFPYLADDTESFWARVMAPGAGNERGIEFLPEVGDEVLVGFEHADINHPFVLGGLWNGQDKTPQPAAEVLGGGKVKRRVIRSRIGHMIVFDDSSDAPSLTIVSKAGHSIKFDDNSDTPSVVIVSKTGHKIKLDDSTDSPSITLVDSSGDNKLRIDTKENSLTIKMAGDTTIQAKGDIKLESDQDIVFSARGEVRAHGRSVGIKGDMDVTVNGGLIKLN
jgi:phage protein D